MPLSRKVVSAFLMLLLLCAVIPAQAKRHNNPQAKQAEKRAKAQRKAMRRAAKEAQKQNRQHAGAH